MAFKGFVSVLVNHLVIILGIVGGIMKISRCEGKRRIGTSMECVSSEKLGNVRISFPFSIFIECLITILIFQRKFFNYGMKYLVWGRDKIGTKGRKRLRSFISRPILGLRNLRLGNTFLETFMLRIATSWKRLWLGNVLGFIYLLSRTYVLPAISSCVYSS